MTQVPASGARVAEPSPLREALRLCGAHLRYAVLFSALVNVAYLAPTFYMLLVYDMVVPSGSEPTLVFVTIALALTLLALTTLDKLRAGILSSASMRLDNVFAGRIFRRSLAAGAGAPPQRLNQTMREFDSIRAAVTGPAAIAMFDAPWIPIYIAVCFVLHWAIGGLTLVSAVVLLVLAVWNERSVRILSRRTLEASSASAAIQEAAGGSADVVRALGMGPAFVSRLQHARRRANLPMMESARASGRISGVIRFLRLLLQSSALGLGAWLAIHKQISAGAIFAASMLASRALSPIDAIVAQWRAVSQAVSAYAAIRSQAADEDARPLTALPRPAPRVAVAGLGVVAPGRNRLLLSELRFSAQGGGVVGVIGPSGAGKTTLMQVLANARGADRGEVRIDGARYEDWDAGRLGALIGYMPQDSVLFPGTVKENISRFAQAEGGDPAEIDARAVAAARQAGVHEMILGLENGYDTPLAARGRGLSAGQQQRLSLARALYGDPVLFVLDEPDASLDAEGEAALVAAISRARANGALVFVAAHRTGLIGVADMLLVLRAGRLERFGPRAEVVDWLRTSQAAKPTPPSAAPAPEVALIAGPGA